MKKLIATAMIVAATFAGVSAASAYSNDLYIKGYGSSWMQDALGSDN